ncbi:MAG TPA: hypothetical protein VIH40_09150 [Xanthobacteraceae bacterium]
MTTVTTEVPGGLIRWHYLGYVALALVLMVVAIGSNERWFLNFVHVICGVMWTGIDLFMGFIIGPIVRRMPLAARRELLTRLVPQTLFLMPTLAVITGTTGWYLAEDLGFTALPWPQYGWVAAALTLVVLMTIQGTGFLMPVNLWVCFKLQKANPDHNRINRVMRNFFYVVALQGLMQVATIVIMARFVSGI